MSFPWLTRTTPTASADARLAVQLRELRDRAALFFRLGYTADAAAARLSARVAWEHDPESGAGGAHRRPAGLSDAEIAQVVRETYARRPSGEL